MSSLRYRPDALLRAARAALQSGLAAQIAAINADLAAEGVSWRLPAVASSAVRIGAQGAELPEHLPADTPTSPTIKLVALPATVTADSANRLGRRAFSVEVSVFIDFSQLVDANGAALPDPPTGDTEKEETVVGAALALREAVRLVLSAPALFASVGVDGTLRFREAHALQDFDEQSGEIYALRAVLTFEVSQRMRYL